MKLLRRFSEKTPRHLKSCAIAVVSLSISEAQVMAEQPPGCQGSSSAVSVILLPAQAAYAVGQQVRFVIVMENSAYAANGSANCNISHASISFTRPDGVAIQVLNEQPLAAGANAIVCPGDPACASPSSSFDYVIREEDLHLIDPTDCPAGPGSTPAFTASVHREGTLDSGSLGEALDDTICYSAAVAKSLLTGAVTFTSSGGQAPEITFTGSISNGSQSSGFLGALQGVTIYQVANGTTNSLVTGISLTNGQVFPFNGSFSSTVTSSNAPGSYFIYASGFNAAGREIGASFSATYPQPGAGRLVLRFPKLQGDGTVQVEADCEPGWNYVIQASTDLIDWTEVYQEATGSNVLSFTDTEAPNFKRRFYRGVIQGPVISGAR